MTSPVYDATSQTVQLHYTNGSQCQGNKQHESYIRLKCKPGKKQITVKNWWSRNTREIF